MWVFWPFLCRVVLHSSGGDVYYVHLYGWLGGFTLWLIMMMDVALWFVWVAMRAQWIDVIAVLRYGGWTRPLPPILMRGRGRLIQILYLYCVESYIV